MNILLHFRKLEIDRYLDPLNLPRYTMAVVAVAGGLGDFGRLVTDALLDTGKYEVYVMSRKVNTVASR